MIRVAISCVIILYALYGCSPAPRYTTIGVPSQPSSGKPSTGIPSSPPSTQKSPDTKKSSSGKTTQSNSFSIGQKLRGEASYYADDFHKKKTSNGETFNMHGLTCAHKTLPFNTWLEVKNISNGRKVIVRVNDRGPFVGNRIIDLSLGAAKELDMIQAGVQQVEIEILRLP